MPLIARKPSRDDAPPANPAEGTRRLHDWYAGRGQLGPRVMRLIDEIGNYKKTVDRAPMHWHNRLVYLYRDRSKLRSAFAKSRDSNRLRPAMGRLLFRIDRLISSHGLSSAPVSFPKVACALEQVAARHNVNVSDLALYLGNTPEDSTAIVNSEIDYQAMIREKLRAGGYVDRDIRDEIERKLATIDDEAAILRRGWMGRRLKAFADSFGGKSDKRRGRRTVEVANPERANRESQWLVLWSAKKAENPSLLIEDFCFNENINESAFRVAYKRAHVRDHRAKKKRHVTKSRAAHY